MNMFSSCVFFCVSFQANLIFVYMDLFSICAFQAKLK